VHFHDKTLLFLIWRKIVISPSCQLIRYRAHDAI